MGIRSIIRSLREEMVTAWSRPDVYARNSPERLGIIYSAKTHLTIADRLVLYTIVRATRPRRILEIGSARGGSASIMAAALEDTGGDGTIISLDPTPSISPKDAKYFARLTMLKKKAPEGISNAMELAGGPFDFVFSDGPNVYNEVKRTLIALLPCIANRASIIVDNGLHYGVNEAVREVVASDSRLHDCGLISVNADMNVDANLAYLGLLLLRFQEGRASDPQPWIDLACREASKPAPNFDRAVLNHDVWWCRKVQPCEMCQSSSSIPSADIIINR